MTIQWSYSNISCGVRQLYALNSWDRGIEKVGRWSEYSHQITTKDGYEAALKDRKLLFEMLKSSPGGGIHYTFIFSDNVGYGNGARLAEFIKAYDLGQLTESPTVRNPNMVSTYIKTWIWTWNGKTPSDYMNLPSEQAKAAA